MKAFYLVTTEYDLPYLYEEDRKVMLADVRNIKENGDATLRYSGSVFQYDCRVEVGDYEPNPGHKKMLEL